MYLQHALWRERWYLSTPVSSSNVIKYCPAWTTVLVLPGHTCRWKHQKYKRKWTNVCWIQNKQWSERLEISNLQKCWKTFNERPQTTPRFTRSFSMLFTCVYTYTLMDMFVLWTIWKSVAEKMVVHLIILYQASPEDGSLCELLTSITPGKYYLLSNPNSSVLNCACYILELFKSQSFNQNLCIAFPCLTFLN